MAISDRLRVRGPIFGELSGGLDSTTIVLLADRILERSGRGSQLLTTVSHTYEKSEDSDETRFIRLVEEARGRTGIHTREQDLGITCGLNDISFTGIPNTNANFPGMYRSIAGSMRAESCRILLSGVGGDELFGSDSSACPELADFLSEGHLIRMFTQACQRSQHTGTPLWRTLLTWGIGPLLNRDVPLGTAKLGLLLTPAWKRGLKRPGCKLGLRSEPTISLPSRRARAFSVRTVQAVFSTNTFCCAGISVSHPFVHQRLIEFMLSLPPNQITRPGLNRYVMRRALHGILPERIRIRLSKAGPDEALCRALGEERDVIGKASDFLVCQRGYVSAQALSETIGQALLGRTENTGALLQVFSCERWLRSLSLIQECRRRVKRNCEDHNRLEQRPQMELAAS
jgi:asparagine synthase (glutamine-hydrolysing)